MLETRFTLILRPDTDDPKEALEDALAFIESAREGWYSSVRLVGKVRIFSREDMNQEEKNDA